MGEWGENYKLWYFLKVLILVFSVFFFSTQMEIILTFIQTRKLNSKKNSFYHEFYLFVTFQRKPLSCILATNPSLLVIFVFFFLLPRVHEKRNDEGCYKCH